MPANIPKKTPAPVRARQCTDDAFVTIIMHNFQYMLDWEPVAHEGLNIRGVHQVRVSYRRMRSAIKNFRRAIPRTITDSVGLEMKTFSRELGPARDLDVFISEVLDPVAGKIGPAEGEAALRSLIEKERAKAYERVRAAIDSPDYKKFKKRLMTWLKKKSWRKEVSRKERKTLDNSIKQYATAELNRRFNRFLRNGENRAQMNDEELHKLRIQGKELRYGCEFFGGLFGQQKTKAFLVSLKAVQSTLGTLHDISVMPEILDPLVAASGDKNVADYARNLTALRAEENSNLRKTLDDQWVNIANAKRPWKGGGGGKNSKRHRK
ncbi:CHAD domain-containing protein [Magnetococcales bacterium HHB-1]